MKMGLVHKKEVLAAKICENEEGYFFQYERQYLENPKYGPVCKTLPLREAFYIDKNMIPFFNSSAEFSANFCKSFFVQICSK